MNDPLHIPVLYFHSVAPVHYPYWVKSFLTMDLRYFEALLRFLKSRGFRSISLQEMMQMRTEGRKVSSDNICLTFDDGYADCWIYAYPLLKKYGFRATVFVAPECVDPGAGLRPNLEDAWKGKLKSAELPVAGYLNWDEMKEMVRTGFVDVQSHTMTHTKYFVSDRLKAFHHPGNRNIYPLWNADISRKPGYMSDPEYLRTLPFGYPLFEEDYAVTARRVFINEDFIKEVTELLTPHAGKADYDFDELLTKVQPVYEAYKGRDQLIVHHETVEEYEKRLDYELTESKRILEAKLGNKVEFCCWPHGGNNGHTHTRALEAGYVATTKGKCKTDPGDITRIERTGFGASMNSTALSNLKAYYRIRSFQGHFPFSVIDRIYKKIK